MSITMSKQALQETLYLRVGMMDEGSEEYERFNEIILIALGVLNPDGTLSPTYADSPFWTLTDGDMLVPSAIVDIVAAMLRTSDAMDIAEALAGLGLTTDQVDMLRRSLDLSNVNTSKHIEGI